MARSYARVITAIWRNAEFRALNGSAQRTYVLLVTQPNISAAGTLPLTVRRWAEMAADTTVESINQDLRDLVAGRFIGADYATEEILVRSFVRHDGGYGNRKRRPVITSAAQELVSGTLRQMITAEFQRLDIAFDGEAPRTGDDPTEPGNSPSFTQVDSLSDSHSDSEPDSQTRFDRVVGCQGEYIDATTHNPQPSPPPAASTRLAAKAANKAAQDLARTYTDLVPLSNFPAVMQIVKKARGAGRYDDEVIRAALVRLAQDGRSVTTDALRYELDGYPAGRVTPNGTPVNRTDANIAALLNRRSDQPNLLALPGGAS